MNENERKMEQLKEKYMNIQPPKEGVKKLEQTINRAKKDKKKVQKIHFLRNIGVGIAAVFAGVVVTVNVNSDLAYAMEQIPVIGNVIKVVTLDHYQVKNNSYSADIKTPKLEAEEETPGIEKVNEAVKKDRDTLIEECRNVFEEDVENSAEIEGETAHYNVDADYEVITDDDNYFVLRFWTEITSASAQQVNKYYTIDRKTGEMLELKDLFKADSDYVKVISDNIKEQMRKQMAEDEDVKYWLDDEEVPEWNFSEIKENQNFYINDDGNIVIAFDEYEVAPGCMGAVSFEIPKDVIASIRK